jgi:WD40 repeat protein
VPDSRTSLVVLTLLVGILGACSPATLLTASPSEPSRPTATGQGSSEPRSPEGLASLTASPSESPQPATSRLGTFELRSPDGLAVGMLSISRVSPDAVAVALDVSISDPGIHPWGIYDQPECTMPTPNHDSPFQFADIENGHRFEELEAASYLAYPLDLVAIVFGGGGGNILGCAKLGPPLIAARPTPSQASCPVVASGPAGAGRPELAFTADVLSNAEIFVMRDDGTDIRRVTDSLGPDFKPSWSPDGQQIAFRTSRDGQDEIYVMNADGTCQRNLTHDLADDRSPAWSPDGASVAYDHFFNDSFQDITVIDVAGLARRRVTRSSGEYPAWSPDGTRIAFASARAGNYDIYVIDADGTNERRLTSYAGYDMDPAWSPDGEWIVYAGGGDSFRHIQIHVMHADGSDDRALTSDEATNRFPAWSLDGRLAWSRDGTIVIADSLDATAVGIGLGQFPAWRP